MWEMQGTFYYSSARIRTMKVLVTGDRNWSNKAIIRHVLLNLPENSIIVHGAASGADSIAGEIAKKWGMKVLSYPAQWTTYGRSAGPIRNRQMLEENPDIELIFAFHNNIEASRGTRDMCSVADKQGIPIRLYTESGVTPCLKFYKIDRRVYHGKHSS